VCRGCFHRLFRIAESQGMSQKYNMNESSDNL
jgi:hypothetical protein